MFSAYCLVCHEKKTVKGLGNVNLELVFMFLYFSFVYFKMSLNNSDSTSGAGLLVLPQGGAGGSTILAQPVPRFETVPRLALAVSSSSDS